MSQRDLKDRSTVLPAGSWARPGIDRSKLRPASGAQPKSLPEVDHQAWVLVAFSPVTNLAGSKSWRPGSLATYISELCTVPSGPSVRVYGVPSSACHLITPVSSLESEKPVTVRVSPASRTSGTTQPSY